MTTTSKSLIGLVVSLIDDDIVEELSFGEGFVSATLGTKSGAVCSPILEIKDLEQGVLKMSGNSFDIEWKDFVIAETSIVTIRNGIKVVYEVKKGPIKTTRLLP